MMVEIFQDQSLRKNFAESGGDRTRDLLITSRTEPLRPAWPECTHTLTGLGFRCYI